MLEDLCSNVCIQIAVKMCIVLEVLVNCFELQHEDRNTCHDFKVIEIFVWVFKVHKHLIYKWYAREERISILLVQEAFMEHVITFRKMLIKTNDWRMESTKSRDTCEKY